MAPKGVPPEVEWAHSAFKRALYSLELPAEEAEALSDSCVVQQGQTIDVLLVVQPPNSDSAKTLPRWRRYASQLQLECELRSVAVHYDASSEPEPTLTTEFSNDGTDADRDSGVITRVNAIVQLIDQSAHKSRAAALLARLPADARRNCLAYLTTLKVDVPDAHVGQLLTLCVLATPMQSAASSSAAAAISGSTMAERLHSLADSNFTGPVRLPSIVVTRSLRVARALRVHSTACSPAGGWQTLVNVEVENVHTTATVLLQGLTLHLDATDTSGSSSAAAAANSSAAAVVQHRSMRAAAGGLQVDFSTDFQASWVGLAAGKCVQQHTTHLQ
jgi:hypothetical protein